MRGVAPIPTLGGCRAYGACCGLIAGLYFAFSAFTVSALGRIDQATGVAAMNAINAAILRSLFMPLFFGTSFAALVLAIVGIERWGEPSAPTLVAGGILYVVGMLAVTVVFNVPLNRALAVVDPASVEATTFWARYLRDWTMRTVAATVAFGLFVAALAASAS